MIIVSEQLDPNTGQWADVDVPVEVHDIETWKARLVENGIGGTFRAVTSDGKIGKFEIKEQTYLDAVDL